MTMNPDIESLEVMNAAKAVLSSSIQVLRDAGYREFADRISGQATRTGGRPVVLVLGERGKGKTSLVDLLSPGLAHNALAQDFGGIYRLVLPAADGVADDVVWVYPDGSRHKNLSPETSPIGVQMRTSSSLLGQVILLDAPSTGGLTGSQSLLNLKILEAASVAVFVTDAGAVLSRAELQYLQQCSAEVETVGVVVTKSDLYPESWSDVVQGNAVLLKRHIPRFADSYVVPVSTVAAKTAMEMPKSGVQETLMAASGLDRLLQVLQRDLSRAGNAPTSNALRMARTGLEMYQQAILSQLAVADAPPEARAEIEHEHQRLIELKEEQQRWTLDLERDLSELRANILREATDRLERWSTQWRNRIQSAKTLRDEKTTGRLTNEIFAELQTLRADVVTESEESLKLLTLAVFRGVTLPAVLHDLLTSSIQPTQEHQLGRERIGTGVDPNLVMSILMGSNMGGALAGIAGIVGGPAVAMAVVGAGGWFAVTKIHRQNMQEKTRLLAEIPRLAQAERAVLSDYLETRIRSLKPELVVSYRAQLQESLAGVQELIRENQRHQQLSAQASQQRCDALKRDLEAIQKQLGAVDATLGEIHRL